MTDSRVVLITGGAGGIGRGLAEAFGNEGDRVVLADRDAPGVEKAAADVGAAGAIAVDITDAAAVQAAVERVAADFGRVDVLINNAGVLNVHGQVVDLSVSDYEQIVRVNVLGTFAVTQAFARYQIGAGRGGVIVNISSIGGRQPTPGMGAYESTKAAVDSITRWAAIELAAHGIRVNAVAPGPVATPMLAAAMGEDSPAGQAWLARIPLGRLAPVDQVARAAVFLAGPDAAHITGVSLPVDGGQLLT